MLVGNEKNQEFFKDLSRLRAHAFLFHGLEGVGKKSLAFQIAQNILGSDPFRSPDFYFIHPVRSRPAKGTATTASGRSASNGVHPEGNSISIEQVRDFKNFFSLTSLSGLKIALIDNVHLLTLPASNSLLKILEEPAGKAYIFLITSEPARLLPTIRSRSLAIRFNPIAKETIRNFLLEKSFDQKLSQEAAELANGSIGIALSLAEDFNKYSEDYQKLKRLAKLPLVERFNFAKELSSGDNLNQAVDNWIMFARADSKNRKMLNNLLHLRYIIFHSQFNARLALENFLLQI